jgi:hypothetical protein
MNSKIISFGRNLFVGANRGSRLCQGVKRAVANSALLLALPALLSGCAAIGWETIAPRPLESGDATVHGVSLQWRENRLTYMDRAKTNRLPTVVSYSTNDIIQILGHPAEMNGNHIRYRTGKRAWRGIAIDFAIFPVPLTIPLMVPGGKTGYVDFVSDENGLTVKGYGPRSRFYGYGAGDNKSGFYWGTEPGFWFGEE